VFDVVFLAWKARMPLLFRLKKKCAQTEKNFHQEIILYILEALPAGRRFYQMRKDRDMSCSVLVDRGAMVLRFVLAMVFVCMSTVLIAQGGLRVHYLPPVEELEEIKAYNLTLLRLALEKSAPAYGAFELVVDKNTELTQQDALRYLSDKKELYVVPTMTDAIRERIFIPVRVPLYKGLFGIRLMIGNEQTVAALEGSSSVDAVKAATFVQGAGWPDTQILKANGFSVVEMTDKNAMMSAVSSGKTQLYPRSIAEIWSELQTTEHKNLRVLNTVYLYYPAPIYFFVQKTAEGKVLAAQLEAGLMQAVKDGSFDQIFDQHMGPMIKKAQLSGKTMLRLNNSSLPGVTPLKDKHLWYIKQ
jgi:hypothetical protein